MSATPVSLRVVLEPRIETHQPELYRAEEPPRGYVDGFTHVDATALAGYAADGFLIVRGGLDAREVEAARVELERMSWSDDPGCDEIYYEGAIRDLLPVAPEDPKAGADARVGRLALGVTADRLPGVKSEVRARHVRKFQGFVSRHPALAATALKPALVDLVAKLSAGSVRLFQDMAMIKPAGGREKPWHQDHAYFNFPLDTRIIGVWIALGEVTPANGCMHVLAGAHREGPRVHFKRRDWQLCDADVLPRRQMALPMSAGDVMIFDAKLPHGTPTNRTQENRWALQYHYVPCEAASVADEIRLSVFGSEGKNVHC